MSLFRTAALAAALILLFGASPAIAGPPIASGHGNLTVHGQLRTFSFNAVDTGDFTAHGHVELTNRDSGVRIHANIECAFVDGNAAVFTAADQNQKYFFGVRDNGEGSAPPDEFTLVADLNPPLDSFGCATLAGLVPSFGGVNGIINVVLGANTSEGGNIQVH